ncbi:site-specific integrase [Streptococcus oralis subsp. dentisani]|jgi:integrase/recombinase, phage associated|uniref:Site-specific integrase n=2 Tax=Streptococcus TaxID=1301 RepID=A0A2I1UC26_STROR|nr:MULTISPECIES: site-specific integrase [Streptococcus]MDI1474048.1 site-specific integrase [Streptococcus sp. ST22-14]PLA03451.1 site-specific integrase [Streptococcus oralis subsp. dentisani]
MNIEKIIHKGKTVLKKVKDNGEISYSVKSVYLGLDIKTGKPVKTTVTAKTLRSLDRKIIQAKIDWEENGSTRKETFSIATLSDLAEMWFSNYETWVSSDNTLNRVRNYLDTYILPKFGHYQPDKITSSDIQKWINELAQKSKESVDAGNKRAKKGSAKDFGAIAHKLREIFNFGITHFELKYNPVQSIKIPPKPKSNQKRIMVLHDEDLTIWLNFVDTLPNTRANRRFKVICDSLLASGMRINELLALTIYDLDFESSEILVTKTLVWKNANPKLGLKGKVVCKNTPKSDSGNRKIAVPYQIIEQLQNFHDEMNLYFKKNGLSKSKLIFPTIYGNYMCDRNERATLKRRLQEVDLPDYGFHLFRHTHASMMLNAGMNWKELQVRMGHKSIKTTMDIYAELAPKNQTQAVDIYLNKIAELTS